MGRTKNRPSSPLYGTPDNRPLKAFAPTPEPEPQPQVQATSSSPLPKLGTTAETSQAPPRSSALDEELPAASSNVQNAAATNGQKSDKDHVDLGSPTTGSNPDPPTSEGDTTATTIVDSAEVDVTDHLDRKDSSVGDTERTTGRKKIFIGFKEMNTPNIKYTTRTVDMIDTPVAEPADARHARIERKRRAMFTDSDLDDDSDDGSDLDIVNMYQRPAQRKGTKIRPSIKEARGRAIKRQRTQSPEFAMPHPQVYTEQVNGIKRSVDEATQKPATTNGDHNPTPDIKAEASEDDNDLHLCTPSMKRNDRIVNENDIVDAELIRKAIEDGKKAGNDIYESDTEKDLPGNAKNIKAPELFRNVRWGDAAYCTDGDWQETEFSQFVPGRWERLPDGGIRDQKEKLLIKITDNKGQRRIFQNPPPKDWNNQQALTALNKRTVQQIRRNTNTRFRAVVQPYAQEERKWILKNLTPNIAKPRKGWSRFVTEFNEQFAGKILKESPNEKRKERTHSSLTKEVERFSEFYKKNLIPVPVKDADKRKVGKEKRRATPTVATPEQ